MRSRYMLPDEETIVTWRCHPACLIPLTIMAVGGFLATVVVTPLLQDITSLQRLMWILVAFLFVQLATAAVNRRRRYFAVTTSGRLILTCGMRASRIVTIPLTSVTDITFEPSVGRLFRHGTITLKYANRADATIAYIPDSVSEVAYRAFRAALPARAHGESRDGESGPHWPDIDES